MSTDRITYFAQTDSRNKKLTFGIKSSDRTRHVYIIGKTGMGKSTMLENMAVQDIQNGDGMAFIDPHGKTAELLLDYVPKDRIKDVVYFAPFDLDYPISFNVMEDVGDDKRHLVVNGLMSAFKKIWVDAWSARMEYILGNTLLALLEYPDSTLLGVNRMLSDKEYRKAVVDNITDTSVKSFWVDEFAKYNERYMQEAGDAIKNKIGQFTSNPLIRNIVGQSKSTFDLRKLMDERKIIIINLSKGQVGEQNASLLGSMLITKIYLSAMSRADASPALLKNLPNFYLYVDEFQSFANESFADILSEARKYKLNLTIAHQYIEQMSEEVRAAVFGNVGSMIAFRVGAYDAEVLEKEFAPQFTAQDLVNLGFVQIYLKLMIDGVTSQPFSATTMPPIERPLINYKADIIKASREQFAHSRAIVELDIRKWHEPVVKPKAAASVKTNAPTQTFAPTSTQRPPQPSQVATRVSQTFSQPSQFSQVPKYNSFVEKKRNEVSPFEQLKRKQQVQTQSNNRNTPPPSDIAPEQESLVPKNAFSSQSVVSRKEDNKISLKQALEAALASQKNKTTPTKVSATISSTETIKRTTTTTDTPVSGATHNADPKEVSEERLRKVLKME